MMTKRIKCQLRLATVGALGSPSSPQVPTNPHPHAYGRETAAGDISNKGVLQIQMRFRNPSGGLAVLQNSTLHRLPVSHQQPRTQRTPVQGWDPPPCPVIPCPPGLSPETEWFLHLNGFGDTEPSRREHPEVRRRVFNTYLYVRLIDEHLMACQSARALRASVPSAGLA